MIETSFSINDLLRRKFQTSLITVSLTLCVTATVYLLLVGENMGFEISLMVEGKLTAGFSTIFSPFIILIGLLSVIAGAVIISFMFFVMMSQRVKDIGLMRASGCPNDLIFGYFMTELLIVTFVGCFLGVVFGTLAYYTSIGVSNFFGFQISQKPVNFWLILVFVLFFALALIFGTKPILDTTKVEPAKAVSPTYQFGLSKEPGFKITSKSSFTTKIALRSLFRRKSATIRIILCLSTVFTLVTVAVAGGIIADYTTKNWIEKAIGRNTVLVAHQDMCDQYDLLLSKFYRAEDIPQFNYTDQRYSVPENLLKSLSSTSGIIGIETRLVLEAHVEEVLGYIFVPETSTIIEVGDNRQGESLIVGVEPGKVLSKCFIEGEFLKENRTREAVIGDSLAQKMFSQPLNQSIRLFDRNFDVTGVCLDPINNGNVTYLPLKALQNATGLSNPNVIMVRVDPADSTEILNQMSANVKAVNLEFEIFELDEVLEKSLSFIGHIWSTIMFLPLFSLIAASLGLIGYVVLTIAEKHQEFGVLRAVGTKPRTVVKIISEQSFIILLSSFAAGVPIGIILTLLILVPEPVVTDYMILQISGLLLVALVVMFVLSLYPALKFARKPILEILDKP
jgi:putative ABC transport system permease protein